MASLAFPPSNEDVDLRVQRTPVSVGVGSDATRGPPWVRSNMWIKDDQGSLAAFQRFMLNRRFGLAEVFHDAMDVLVMWETTKMCW